MGRPTDSKIIQRIFGDCDQNFDMGSSKVIYTYAVTRQNLPWQKGSNDVQ
jgi:hypothetical protein